MRNYLENKSGSIEGKTLLITGGTGSFGGALVKRLIGTDIKEIRVFSRDEKKQEDMRLELKTSRVKFYIGDVRNYDSISEAMIGVDYVFHAAALKQVPSCEFHPMEAFLTNVVGADNVAKAALLQRVEKLVLLSTDKAVYPVNAMGISKAMMEKLMVARARLCRTGDTIFCATRYGNVMGSRGSVIPLFVNRILSGLSLTVTDPHMTRFLMTLDDAVDLVMYALNEGKQGEILVHKANASSIENIVVALKDIFCADNAVEVIGTRHGEKLHEVLLTREELARSRESERFFNIPHDNRDLNYENYFVNGKASISLSRDYSSDSVKHLTLSELKATFLSLDCVREAMHD
jgi:UDP-N-acetylglucosamine 4,6-dehydratase